MVHDFLLSCGEILAGCVTNKDLWVFEFWTLKDRNLIHASLTQGKRLKAIWLWKCGYLIRLSSLVFRSECQWYGSWSKSLRKALFPHCLCLLAVSVFEIRYYSVIKSKPRFSFRFPSLIFSSSLRKCHRYFYLFGKNGLTRRPLRVLSISENLRARTASS